MTEESVDDLLRLLDSLRLQEASVLERIKEARNREKQHREAQAFLDVVFPVGCTVEITNAVKPLNESQRTTIKDKRGIVTRITPTRVYLTTGSGNYTWRARKNLKRLTPATL